MGRGRADQAFVLEFVQTGVRCSWCCCPACKLLAVSSGAALAWLLGQCRSPWIARRCLGAGACCPARWRVRAGRLLAALADRRGDGMRWPASPPGCSAASRGSSPGASLARWLDRGRIVVLLDRTIGPAAWGTDPGHADEADCDRERCRNDRPAYLASRRRHADAQPARDDAARVTQRDAAAGAGRSRAGLGQRFEATARWRPCEAEYPAVTAHHHPTRISASRRGATRGLRSRTGCSGPEYLLFLDNDLVLQPGFVESLLETFAGNPRPSARCRRSCSISTSPSASMTAVAAGSTSGSGGPNPVGFKQLDRGQCEQVAPCISCGGSMVVRDRVVPRTRRVRRDLQSVRTRGPRLLAAPAETRLQGAVHPDGRRAARGQPHVRERGLFGGLCPLESQALAALFEAARHSAAEGRLLHGGCADHCRPYGFREVLRGNPGAVVGSVRGLVEAMRSPGRGSR
jgi:hypothetical protein